MDRRTRSVNRSTTRLRSEVDETFFTIIHWRSQICNIRGFKILLAKIRVINGDYDNAVKIYDALVKEEPRVFWLHWNRGIVYIQWWRRVMMMKVFAHKVESERASLKS
ncbi:putative tetratricopeptide-like helical domain superfamily [Helianthus anomalus]